MKIRCIAPVRSANNQDVISDGFTVGNEYPISFSSDGRRWYTHDDNDEMWCVQNLNETDGRIWMDMYFVVIYDHDEAWDRAMGVL